MDDFGTGYSSLSYLNRFPFDKLKIEKSFVQQMDKSKEAMSILDAIVALGQSLEIRTTAEGVETAAQLEQLRRKGCTEVQGYLFSRPVPAVRMRQLLPCHPVRSLPLNIGLNPSSEGIPAMYLFIISLL